jgi:putative flavoprotein involved in K+ transport
MDVHGHLEFEQEHFDTLVIGGGQAGLAVGHSLARQGVPFVILDADQQIGDAWRRRWDSLRLFSPRRYDGLPGVPFPGPPSSFPTKDEMADYLQAYADRFELPVRSGVRVDRLSRNGDGFEVAAGGLRLTANNVVVAMGTHQVPWRPSFVAELDPQIFQLHAGRYLNPSQLREGPVLVVGAGNSGAEIALDVSASRPTFLSGRDTGHIPFNIESTAGRHVGVRIVMGFVFHHVLTMKTPVGRKVRPKLLSRGMPLVRTRPKSITAAGVERVPRVEGVRDGSPVLEDGRVMDVQNVIWCTGYRPDFSWIDLPVFDGDGAAKNEPIHERGVVAKEPGLFFVGLFFLYAASSELVRGVGRDAEYIAQQIARRLSGDRDLPVEANR